MFPVDSLKKKITSPPQSLRRFTMEIAGILVPMFTFRTSLQIYTSNTRGIMTHVNGNFPMAKKIFEEIGIERVGLYNQLWHACAGLSVNVPRTGDWVFYFPQGHLEQVAAYMEDEIITNIPNHSLPSRILCKVAGIELKAVPETEEVFAQITLLPVSGEPERPSFRTVPQKVPASYFRKVLSNSDASTHGACILPKSCVEKTFPPLDLSCDAVSQNLIARDINGATWHFQHTYRGTPKRHLLTNGWSQFVSAKRLVAGDTCIFMRGLAENEILIGVQRAGRLHKKPTELPCVSMQHGILSTAYFAMNTRTKFTVYYYPRLTASSFIVAPVDVLESLKINYSPQMGFAMVVDAGGEEPEHILKKGIITANEDIDPIRWRGSEWQCLKVQWDVTTSRHIVPSRVSPWDIQPLDLVVPHKQPPSTSVDQNRSTVVKPVIRD